MYFASYDDKEIARLGLSFNDVYFIEWFLTFQQSNKMLELPKDVSDDPEHTYYWILFDKIINDLPALQMNNHVSINNMMNRLCGKGKLNSNEYPLMRQCKNVNFKNKAYFAIRPEVIARMKGVEYHGDLFDESDIPAKSKKQIKNETLGSLNTNTEKILIVLDKLSIDDGRKLFSFTLPNDHKMHTKSMKHFQDALYDLYEGRFMSRHKIEKWFLDRNKYYITNETISNIQNCKHNWNQISDLQVVAVYY